MIKAAAGNIKAELEDSEGFDKDNFDLAVTCVLRWLWCVNNNVLVLPVLGLSNDLISSSWSKSLYDTYIRHPSNTSPDPS